ncbi:MAG: UDP-N-acetylglucosamine 2-epimerase (non-hydrolyzing) [Bacteroidia bacterium]|nr:MAG: UDP-N-acetylglucosamine 2-epimerase (non-hydrolyzing) [Bacteroidia bacterium]
MGKKKILIVVGTRPNFIKVTQFKPLSEKYPSLEIKIVHTSQHYSDEMSKLFFEELDLQPDYFLDIPTNLSVVSQMVEIMKGLEKLINEVFYPDLMMVVGDVNSTLAGALVANKMNIPLAHLESGLRSFDDTMPEEYNRILTDRMTKYFFVTEMDAVINLKNEGIAEDKIFFVGNTMIDTLVAFQDKIQQSKILEKLNVRSKEYALVTLHRPGNVDTEEGLKKIISLFQTLQYQFSDRIKHFVFPIHPRTANNFRKFQLWDTLNTIPSLIITQPQSYINFQKLVRDSLLLITDSGGVQEETSYLKIPCITLRPSTERPVTLWEGSNILLPFESGKIIREVNRLLNKTDFYQHSIPMWDGRSTERILSILSML